MARRGRSGVFCGSPARIELGLNFIDTALAYGEGHSEQLVAEVVRDASRRVYVATKVPPKNYLWPAQPGIGIEQVFPYHHIPLSTSRASKTCASRPSIAATARLKSGVDRSRRVAQGFRRTEALRQGSRRGYLDQRLSAGFSARNYPEKAKTNSAKKTLRISSLD